MSPRPWAGFSRQTVRDAAEDGDLEAEYELDLRDEYDRDERESED